MSTFPRHNTRNYRRSLKSVLLCFLALGLATGCATSPREFPVGLYGVPPDAFREVRALGFNTITGPPDRHFLDAARKAGLRVLASAGGHALRTNAVIREQVTGLDNHPALWAWYLMDEPDLHRIPPSEVVVANSALKRIARKPTLLVLMSGSAAANYGDICDLLAVDFYPVPWAPVSQFAKEMKLARFQRGQKPYFAILQAFDWSISPELLGLEGPFRPPTKDELRCMVYMAAAQEADGLFFYSYQARDWRLPAEPLWEGVKEVVAEVNRHLPIFTAEHVWWSPALEYLEGDDHMYNEVRDGKIMLSRLRVKHGNASTPAGEYVLAINTTGEMVPFRLQLPTNRQEVEILGIEKKAPLEWGVVRKDFSAYEVIIYGPLP